MEYTYRKLDSWGSSLFRILMRRDSSDAWQVVPGTFDYDREEDARTFVDLLRKGQKMHTSLVCAACGAVKERGQSCGCFDNNCQ